MWREGHPYGVWYALYQTWLAFVEGIWPLLEEAFLHQMELTDTQLDEKWHAFLQQWDEACSAVVRDWMSYPLWRNRGTWIRLLGRWHTQTLEFRGLMLPFAEPAMRVPEVWPDLRTWFQHFRPWGEQIQTGVEVLWQIHQAPTDTAAWERYRHILEGTWTWKERSVQSIVELQRRVRVFGQEWTESVRQQWLLWGDRSYSWTLQWYALWEEWALMPLVLS